jgi:8-oxo-dGTP pyrophosphatase MutT (NUDIX family)
VSEPASTKPRPGYGMPHPDVLAVLRSATPLATARIVWPGGLLLDLAAYHPLLPLPSEFVTSVRCLVQVDDQVIVCEAPDGPHIWPGGRRMAGESYEATARREVYEETGRRIEERLLEPLGFLHYRFVDDPPHNHPYPHPDFLQIVYTTRIDGGDIDDSDPAGGTGWVDVEGWEQGHHLHPLSELDDLQVSAPQRAFLDLLVRR